MLSESLPLQTCWVCWSWIGADATHVRRIIPSVFFMLSLGIFGVSLQRISVEPEEQRLLYKAREMAEA